MVPFWGPPPPHGISGLGDQMDQTVISSPKNTFFEFLTFVNFWSTFGTPNRIDIFQFWIDFRTLPCPISSILGSQRGPGEVLFGYVLGLFFWTGFWIDLSSKKQKMKKWKSGFRCVKYSVSWRSTLHKKVRRCGKLQRKKQRFFRQKLGLIDEKSR